LSEWDGNPEGGIGKKLRGLRALCQDVVELRRGDHSSARLKIEQERLDRDREKTEADIFEYFQRWAKNPKVRDSICGECVSPAERERRLREIFGLSPPEAAHSNQTNNGDLAGSANGGKEESDSIKPNQTP
jgi:hypothetical protein